MGIETRVFPGKRLSECCTFGIGGPARFYFAAREPDELIGAFQWALQRKIPCFILGKGSNCLFDDRGWDGLVIRNRIELCEIEEQGKECSAFVGAGYSFALLGRQMARRGFSGLEFASGIPGTVGGAVYMNAGACGQETFDCLQEVLFVTDQGEKKKYSRAELKSGYRFSSFQELPGAILGARFVLKEDEGAQERTRLFIQQRIETQPLHEKSAGCVFRNPSSACSAGALIDRLGLKGLRVGGAKVSEIHANFIVNCGEATAQDVRALIQKIQGQVFEKTGTLLVTEIKIVPYEEIRSACTQQLL